MRKLLYAFLALFLVLFTLTASAQLTLPPNLLAQYNEIKAFVSQSQSGDFGPIPPPPIMYFDYCYPCDNARKEKYAQDSINFLNTYLRTETEYLNKISNVMSGLQTERARPMADTPTIDNMSGEMYQALLVVSQLKFLKLNRAWNQYKEDAQRNFFVGTQLLNQLRFRDMNRLRPMGGVPTPVEIVEQLIKSGMEMFTKARDELDYPVLLNIGHIGDLYRMAASLAITEEQLQVSLFEFLNANRFKFYIETSSRSNGRGGTYQFAQLISKGTFIAAPDANCKLQWKLIEPDTAAMLFELKAIEWNMEKYGKAPYTGTYKYVSPPPEIKLDFCDEKRDTAHFFSFEPYDGKETWHIKSKTFDERYMPLTFMMPLYIIGFANTEQFVYTTTKPVYRFLPSVFGFFVKGKLINKQKLVFDQKIDGRLGPMLPEAWFKLRIEHED